MIVGLMVMMYIAVLALSLPSTCHNNMSIFMDFST